MMLARVIAFAVMSVMLVSSAIALCLTSIRRLTNIRGLSPLIETLRSKKNLSFYAFFS
jgi:hypothetical protein